MKSIILLNLFTQCLSLKVSFYTSPGCRQCIRFKSVFEKIKDRHPTIEFETIEITQEKNKIKAKNLNISKIPMVIFNDSLEEENRMTGIPKNYELIEFRCNELSGIPNKNTPSNFKFKHEHITSARKCMNIYIDDGENGEYSEASIYHEPTNVQSTISVDGDTVFICFRGTTDLSDWKNNLSLGMHEYPYGSKRKFHSGFLLKWTSVKNEVLTKLDEIIYKKRGKNVHIKNIVFTGHSSAGCISVIASYDCIDILKKKYGIKPKAITFGSPRCCNNEFKNYVNHNMECTRFIMEDDIVPRLPMPWIIAGYHHVGKGIHLDEECSLEKKENKSRKVIINHGMRCYIESLETGYDY